MQNAMNPTPRTRQIMDLPDIPSLPPIEMPHPSSFIDTSLHCAVDGDDIFPSQLSTTSFSSRDSTQSSSTSPSRASPDFIRTPTPTSPDLSHPPSQSLVPPSVLRKSISVDSFITYQQFSNITPRSARGHTMGSKPIQERPTYDYRRPLLSSSLSQQSGLVARPLHRPTVLLEEADGLLSNESDVERADDVSRYTRKGNTQARLSTLSNATVNVGDLTMPSRLQTSSSSPTMAPPKSPRDRTSNGSLNKLTKQRSLMSVNTQIISAPSAQLSTSSPELCIAVIGATGCGKSMLIHKGLKSNELSEQRTAKVGSNFSYAYRTTRVPIAGPAPDRLLRTLEIDIAALDLNQTESLKLLPPGVPSVDAVMVCYDVSDESSFGHIEDVLSLLARLGLPSVLISCKNDLEKRIDPERVDRAAKKYDIGLIEVNNATESSRDKMRCTWDWVIEAIDRHMAGLAFNDREKLWNSASPSVLTTLPAPWDISRASSATPTASSMQQAQQSQTQQYVPAQVRPMHVPLSPIPVNPPRSPSTPTSPTRARSTSDLMSEHEKSRRENREREERGRESTSSGRSAMLGPPRVKSRRSSHAGTDVVSNLDDINEGSRENLQTARSMPWMTLEELLDKLLFLCVSDDDPTFISHFLLTYRRFASPRNILLAMQKRMRALDQPTNDPMFASYAQMRICSLLDDWIRLYPTDFAVPGTAGALSALIKSILSKTYLLHYGSEFLPFSEMVSTLQDQDSAWAMKVEDPTAESDESSGMSDDDGFAIIDNSSVSSTPSHTISENNVRPPLVTRERKPSLPLTAKVLVLGNSHNVASIPEAQEHSPKAILKKLQAVCQELNVIDPNDIAQEITRLESQFFMRIQPRHWMRHVIPSGLKDPETDTISMYNTVSNHIADWVVSLILCHDKPKARCKQIEKFIEIANRLRQINNYSALRAVIAGINSATFDGDITMELLKVRNQQLWKNYSSWDHLLRSARSHQKYRMALRNTKGACIPALEIHLSDLIRADEGNPDHQESDPSKIHWAKFNMFGRFIDMVTQCQEGCRQSMEYNNYPSRLHVRTLLLLDKDDYLMDVEMQRSRIAPPEFEGVQDGFKPSLQRPYSRESPHQTKDTLRKMMFW